jgi:hypothetical protein
MNRNTTRITAVLGTTLALVVAGTAAVAAHPGDGDDRGFGWGKAGIGAGMDDPMMRGLRGLRGTGGLGGALDEFERREVTLQTVDGVTTQRVEQGTVDSISDDALSYSLESGESVTVVIDEDTGLLALDEEDVTFRRGTRTRLVPTEIEAADIEAGAEIVVWSDSEDGADFVASRVVVQPAEDEEAAETEADEAATATDA